MADDGAATRLIAGRYRLESLIGRGGAGAVWRGHDEQLRRPVAVKEITFPGDEQAMTVGRQRALREARAAARLRHPGVIGVYDIIEEGGSAFLIMELVDAPNLNGLVRREGPLTPRAAARLGLRMLNALTAAHRAGVVHRDVKPSNVLVDGDRPKLTDFGIARLGDDATLTSTGVVLGTPAYIAPEHASGGDVGPPADLYGLGATLFYAVEGMAPFGERGAWSTVMAVLNGSHRPMRRAGALEPLLTDLLTRDPAGRPGAAEVRRRLRRVVDGADVRPTGPPPAGGDVIDQTGEIAAREVEGTGEVDPEAAHVAPSAGDLANDDQADDAGREEHAGAAAASAVDEGPRDGASVADGVPAPAPPAPPADRAGQGGGGDGEPLARDADPPRRTAVLASVIAVLLVLGLAWAASGDDPPADDAQGDPTPGAGAAVAETPSGASTPAAPSSAPAPPPSEPSSPEPTPSPSPAGDGVLPAYEDVEVPDGWVEYRPDEEPYRLEHPPEWAAVRNSAQQTDLRDPQTGTYLRLEWVEAARDPVPDRRAASEAFAQSHEGYRNLGIRPTTYRGERAALWEYRYREGGAELHAYSLVVNDGEFGYGLNLQARESDWDEARELWPALLSSYRLEGG